MACCRVLRAIGGVASNFEHTRATIVTKHPTCLLNISRLLIRFGFKKTMKNHETIFGQEGERTMSTHIILSYSAQRTSQSPSTTTDQIPSLLFHTFSSVPKQTIRIDGQIRTRRWRCDAIFISENFRAGFWSTFSTSIVDGRRIRRDDKAESKSYTMNMSKRTCDNQ